MIATKNGSWIFGGMLGKYFDSLVNGFYKILPMRENEEKTLATYEESLQSELIGCSKFIPLLHDDARFISLLSILQYLIDTPQCPVGVVKREVFKAIRICNKLKAEYEEAVQN